MITAYEFINNKRRGLEHTAADIEWFVKEYVNGATIALVFPKES